MCDPNENTVIALDFVTAGDQGNWQTTSQTPVQTIGGKLLLDADSNSAEFKRAIGTVDPTNNRLTIKSNFSIEIATGAPPTMEVVFDLFVDGNKLGSSCAEFANIQAGANYVYHLDRTFKMPVVGNGNVTLVVTIPEGFQNQVFLTDLSVADSLFCEDNVRSYFVIDELFEDALAAQSAGIELLEWKVDDVETLTPQFFAENNSPGGDPRIQWLLAKADIDGSNRVSDNSMPNSFNPFVDEFGLEFDTASSFHGGKPIGTVSGSDYGPGLLAIGLLKPVILNGALNSKKGAFFVDIDFSKRLKISFNVILNKSSTNLFSNPDYLRTYFIEVDERFCTRRFYYVEDGVEVDQDINGFLSGITSSEINEVVVPCDEAFAPSGASGNFTYVLDFGTEIGTVGIEYNAFSVPDRFIVEYDGVTYDTGFVGSSSQDQNLINAGVDPVDINTANPSNGSGSLIIPKPNALPSQATITVLAPLGSTAWNVKGICAASVPPIASIIADDTSVSPGTTVTFDVTASDSDGTIESWMINYGDGATDSGLGSPPAQFMHSYSVAGGKTITLSVTDNDGNTTTVTETLTVQSTPRPGGIRVDVSSEGNCYSCFRITVTVPQGETRQVEFNSTFAPSGAYAAGFCPIMQPGDDEIGLDTIENISQTTSFVFGIDGAQGSNQVPSSINVIVRDGGSVEDSQLFTRTHANSNC